MVYINQRGTMPKFISRTDSRYRRDAAALLGALIREARNERKLTAQGLANRAGISRGLMETPWQNSSITQRKSYLKRVNTDKPAP